MEDRMDNELSDFMTQPKESRAMKDRMNLWAETDLIQAIWMNNVIKLSNFELSTDYINKQFDTFRLFLYLFLEWFA